MEEKKPLVRPHVLRRPTQTEPGSSSINAEDIRLAQEQANLLLSRNGAITNEAETNEIIDRIMESNKFPGNLTALQTERRVCFYPFEWFRSQQIKPLTYHIDVEKQDLFLAMLRKLFYLKFGVAATPPPPEKLVNMQHELLAQDDRKHRCFHALGEVCQMDRYVMHEIFPSETLGQNMRATGRIMFCAYSGYSHVCDDHCQGIGDGMERVCPYTGIHKGLLITMVPTSGKRGRDDDKPVDSHEKKINFLLANGSRNTENDTELDSKEAPDVIQHDIGNTFLESDIPTNLELKLTRNRIRQDIDRITFNRGQDSKHQTSRRRMQITRSEEDKYRAEKRYTVAIETLDSRAQLKNVYTYRQFVERRDHRIDLVRDVARMITNTLHFNKNIYQTQGSQMDHKIVNLQKTMVTYLRSCNDLNVLPNACFAYMLMESILHTDIQPVHDNQNELIDYYTVLVMFYWSRLHGHLYSDAVTHSTWITHMREFTVGFLMMLQNGYTTKDQTGELRTIIPRHRQAVVRINKKEMRSNRSIASKWVFNSANPICNAIDALACNPATIDSILYEKNEKFIVQRVREAILSSNHDHDEGLFVA